MVYGPILEYWLGFSPYSSPFCFSIAGVPVNGTFRLVDTLCIMRSELLNFYLRMC